MPRKYVDILCHLEILKTLHDTEVEIEFVRKEAMKALYAKEETEEQKDDTYINIEMPSELEKKDAQ